MAEIANKVVTGLMAPFDVIGMEIFAGCSLGITMFPADGTDFDSLLKKADIAMYRAKESGRNAFRFWDGEMNASVVEHVELLSAMRAALAHREFTLSYQPQFDLRTGRLIGAEALIRWRHAELGNISPARFIPLAERSGLIIPIGDWVLQEACAQAQRWRAAGWTDLTISVNVSPVQFRRGSVETSVAQALADSGLPSANLELELTESLLIQDSLALAESLASLRRMGVRFAIDDFGTGYSNLAYLKRFEVERLKIDQTFVRRLTDDVQDQAIVRAIVQMASSLNLFTVAEGVEDGATLALAWRPRLPAGPGLPLVAGGAGARVRGVSAGLAAPGSGTTKRPRSRTCRRDRGQAPPGVVIRIRRGRARADARPRVSASARERLAQARERGGEARDLEVLRIVVRARRCLRRCAAWNAGISQSPRRALAAA